MPRRTNALTEAVRSLWAPTRTVVASAFLGTLLFMSEFPSDDIKYVSDLSRMWTVVDRSGYPLLHLVILLLDW